jgi:hypothetical protein
VPQAFISQINSSEITITIAESGNQFEVSRDGYIVGYVPSAGGSFTVDSLSPGEQVTLAGR